MEARSGLVLDEDKVRFGSLGTGLLLDEGMVLDGGSVRFGSR